MKNRFLLFIIFCFHTSFLYAQEEFLNLSQNLTDINQDTINENLNETFKEQKASVVETLPTSLIELQVANEELKKRLSESKIPSCLKTTDENEKEKAKKKNEDGGWEVVLLVKATHEKLGDSETNRYINTINENSRFNYVRLLLADNPQDLEKTFQDQIQNMREEEVLDYISYIGAYLPYDKKRASGDGENKKGVRNLFDILQSQVDYFEGNAEEDAFGGICGDIHYALGELVKVANKSGKMNCDYITMSYQTTSIGHVIGGCANSDGSFLVLNYGELRNIENPNGVASLAPGNNGSVMPHVGTRMRIFGHDEKGSEHIATLKNEIGSFLYSMNLKASKQSASPLYEDYSSVAAELNHKRQTKRTKGDKEITKSLNEGLRFYTGKLQGGQDIFGVALYSESTKTNNKNNTVLFNSNALSVNGVNYPSSNSVDKTPVNLYFVHHFGVETPIIQKRNFKLVGEVSEQIELIGVKTGKETSVDGDLTLNTKLKTQITSNDKKTNISGALSVDHVVGLKDERLIADLNTIPSNIKFTTNAINLSTYAGRKIASDKSVGIGTNATTTQVGSKYEIFTDYSQGAHRIYVQYENASKGFGKYDFNILPNAGPGLEVGHDITIPYKRSLIEASSKVSFDMQKNFFVGVGVKLKINGRKK